MKDKDRFSSLFIIVLLLVFAIAGLGHFDNRALEVHAQRSSSCIDSLGDCSPSASDGSSADDNDERDNNDGDNDNNKRDQKDDKKAGDIEAKIPSTAGIPFP